MIRRKEKKVFHCCLNGCLEEEREQEDGEGKGVLVNKIPLNRRWMGFLPVVLVGISGKNTPWRPSYTKLLHSPLGYPGFLNAIDQIRWAKVLTGKFPEGIS